EPCSPDSAGPRQFPRSSTVQIPATTRPPDRDDPASRALAAIKPQHAWRASKWVRAMQMQYPGTSPGRRACADEPARSSGQSHTDECEKEQMADTELKREGQRGRSPGSALRPGPDRRRVAERIQITAAYTARTVR